MLSRPDKKEESKASMMLVHDTFDLIDRVFKRTVDALQYEFHTATDILGHGLHRISGCVPSDIHSCEEGFVMLSVRVHISP